MQISVSLSDELLKEVDSKRGVTNRSHFIAKCIYEYLHPPPTPDKAALEKMERDLVHAQELLAEKDSRVRELNENMGWLRSQYSELQTKLLPAPKKSWWDRIRGR